MEIRIYFCVPLMKDRKLTAVFIDFESCYFFLIRLYEMTPQDASKVVVAILASQLEKDSILNFV